MNTKYILSLILLLSSGYVAAARNEKIETIKTKVTTMADDRKAVREINGQRVDEQQAASRAMQVRELQDRIRKDIDLLKKGRAEADKLRKKGTDVKDHDGNHDKLANIIKQNTDKLRSMLQNR